MAKVKIIELTEHCLNFPTLTKTSTRKIVCLAIDSKRSITGALRTAWKSSF